MRSLLILLIIAAAIVVPLMILHRRFKAKREAAELREAAVLQDAVFTGSKNMRDGDISRCPVMSRAGSKPELRVVDKPAQADDSAWMFGATAMSDASPTKQDDHVEVRTPGIFKGQGGSFDGAGASGDYSTPSTRYDSSPSEPSTSSDTSSSDTSSSSSDSGSSSSSSD